MTRIHTCLFGLCTALAACDTAPTESAVPDAGLNGVNPTAAVVNTWATKAPIPLARSRAVAGARNNIIYVVGGEDALHQATKTVQAYTIATNSWASKADLPVSRASANGASLLNGRLYVSGGRTSSGPTKTLYAYNPSTNTWIKRANMPVASACGAQGVIGRRLYVYAPGVGGACGSVQGFYRYDPATDKWTSLAKAPSVHMSLPLPSKQQMGAGAALNGRLYVAGGYDYTVFDFIASLRVHNPGANSWSSMAPMLTPRMYAAGVNAGGKGLGDRRRRECLGTLPPSSSIPNRQGSWSTLSTVCLTGRLAPPMD